MADLSGQRLGPFEIRSLLGTGGFATVYLAHDPRLSSDVAIKILAENHALDPTMRERFIGEAHALRRVESGSVINIFDIRETDDGRPYLVLEFADRGDLVRRREGLAANGWQPGSADAALVIESLADALDAIHAEELVHRDVTPSNMLIRSSRRKSARAGVGIVESDERLMLSDMGLVKDLSAGSGLTVGGGTAGFWAPEQRDHLTRVDHRTDLYSATSVVIWLLAGQPPLLMPEWPTAIQQRGFGPPVAAELGRGLAEAPQDRHQTAIEWRDALLASFGATASSATVTSTQQPSPATAPAPQPVQPVVADSTPPAAPVSHTIESSGLDATGVGRRLALAVAGLALAAVIGVGAFFALRDSALNPESTARDATTIAITETAGAGTLTIVGPERLVVGEPAQFRAEADNVRGIVWIDPSGAEVTNEVLEVEALSEGRGTVTAIGLGIDGTPFRIELNFEADAPATS